MKILLLLLLITSCGKHTLLTMPEIDLDYDTGGSSDHRDTTSQGVRVQASTLANCNMITYRNRCTGVLITTRQLLPHELYNNFCGQEYIQCLGLR